MTLLNDGQIEQELSKLGEWQRVGQEIERVFELEDFVGAVQFVDQVVAPAEKLGHHPDVSISWNRVGIRISTHSEGGLTAADFLLAAEIDKLA